MYPKKRWTDQLLDSVYRHYCVLLYLNLFFDIQAHIFAQQYIQVYMLEEFHQLPKKLVGGVVTERARPFFHVFSRLMFHEK